MGSAHRFGLDSLQNAAMLCLFCGAASCQIDDVYIYRDAGVRVGAAPEAFASVGDLYGFLEAKTWMMSPADIPSHPNGYDQNVNYGQATQCLHEASMVVQNQSFTINSTLGTLKNAPRNGDVGACDRSTSSGTELHFDTTASLIENMRDNGACFDITLTYSGFGQEGRGGVREDGAVALELFFRDQATGHRCADGDVGSPTVTLNREHFTGDAVQLYR